MATLENSASLEDGYLGAPAVTDRQEDGASEFLEDRDWIELFRNSLRAASEYQQQKLKPAWSRNYRAFNNKHVNGSKYDTHRYRHRSKLFKPKTRMAVRKNDATAASALFSTVDVVSVTPERSSDRKQLLTARFLGAALNYRLNRSDRFTGPNWFMTAIGARQDTQLSGVCFSKQHWEYETEESEVEVDQPKIDENGTQVLDEAGEQVFESTIEVEDKVIADRLMITLIPPEHGFTDPTADWRDPVQSGGYFFAAYPVRLDDVEDMISRNARRPKVGGGAWRTDIDVKKLTQARAGEIRRNESVRRSREDGADRYESRFNDTAQKDIIWLYECFYKYGGRDWHFWMLGEHILLSDPRPTRDSYPEQKGDRPYTMGVGALESHKTHPMAPVESWQPLQQELNDITNLTLDAQKMTITPITKIKRGRNIDLKAVQNRGPDANVMVEDVDDVTFEKAPGPTGEQQLQINNLNTDFDELSGTFSQGSVQTNRQLNETVGGMNILAGSANAMTEFDLRVWVETWVQPTLRQCVRLIQYYESSEVVLAVAGENAGLIMLPNQQPPEPGPLDQTAEQMEDGQQAPQEEPLPIAEILNDLDNVAVSVRVDVGIGALDSRQKLEKFLMGTKATLELMPILQMSGIAPNGAEMMQELWGLNGYQDGDRFFMKAPEQGPPPELQKVLMEMQLAQQKAQQEMAMRQQEMQMRQAEFQLEMKKTLLELQADKQRLGMEQQRSEMEMAHQQRQTALDEEAKRSQVNLDLQAKAVQHEQQKKMAADQHNMKLDQGDQAFRAKRSQDDLAFQAKQKQAEEAAKLKQKQQAAAAKAKPKPKAKPSGGKK